MSVCKDRDGTWLDFRETIQTEKEVPGQRIGLRVENERVLLRGHIASQLRDGLKKESARHLNLQKLLPALLSSG